MVLMKKLLFWLGIGVLAVVGLLSWSVSAVVLGDDYEFVAYSAPAADTAYGTLYVGFVKATEDKLTAWIDLNDDGNFTDEEKVLADFPFRASADWRTGFGVKFSGRLPEAPRVKIELAGGDNVEATLRVTRADAEDLLELQTVTDPENAMKGFGVVVARAEEPITSAARPGVPDLGQRIAECAPTAAANSIMSLAEENGMSLSELPTPTEMVDGLKGEMDWTPANGVLPDNFVEGKNRWAATHGLPIVTEKVGDQHGRKTLESILDAMGSEAGAAAEVRIKFAQNGKVTGGHMVTVVGVHVQGDEVYIDVNDPKTPAGTETYRVEGNVIENYPYEGDAILSWGFVQRWQPPTGTALEPMTEAEVAGIRSAVGVKEKIQVIVTGGKKIPLSEVHLGTGPECKKGGKEMPHWHANVGEKATAIDGTVVRDPGGCGYGMAINVPVEEVEIP